MINEFEKESSDNVVIENEEIWKKAKGFLNLYVSNLGRVKKLLKNGDFIPVKGNKWRTTKGYYLYVYGFTDDADIKSTSIHRIVCETFNGDPPSEKHDVNHKDGDKLNNRADNLEWLTRSENVLHAFSSGLCQVGVRVQATNVLTGEIKNFNSLSAAAREWNVCRREFRTIVSKHKRDPYFGEWIFKTDNVSDKKLKRYQSVPVIVKDYVTGTITVYEDIASAAEATSVQSATLELRTREKSVNNRYGLIAGYVIKKVNDIGPFPDYPKELAEFSRKTYFSDRKSKRMSEAIEVTDIIAGTTKIYKSKVDFAADIGKPKQYTQTMREENTVYRDRYKFKFVFKT